MGANAAEWGRCTDSGSIAARARVAVDRSDSRNADLLCLDALDLGYRLVVAELSAWPSSYGAISRSCTSHSRRLSAYSAFRQRKSSSRSAALNESVTPGGIGASMFLTTL